EIKTYTLTVDTVGNGSVDIEPDKNEYEHGDKVNLSATPDESHEFLEWTGDHTSTDEQIQVTMDSDKTVTAHFEIKTYTLTVDTVGNGSVDIKPEKTEYDHGDVVNLTAVPDEGYEFVEWTGDHAGTEEQITITMTSDVVVEAHFLQEANFEVEIISSFSGVEVGEDITVKYRVSNTGEVGGEQQITFTVYDDNDGQVYENQTQVTLEGGESSGERVFEWNAEESGDYTLEIATDDDTAEAEMTVDGKTGGSVFEVTTLEVVPEEPATGEEIEVTVEVTNTGETSDEYTAELIIDDETIDTKSVNIDAGQTETVTFTHSIDEEGEYEVEVGGEDTSVDVVEDDGLPMTYIFGGVVVLILVVILALIVKKGGSSDEYYDNTETHDLDDDDTLNGNVKDESGDYDLSKEEKDEIDLYG
ncbi:MAG: InlB B-repeat-containing protein, partial [Thermoplasmata archaeon]